MAAGRCREGEEGEENTDFEAKFSFGVNWMMNDGRCTLNCIPLTEPFSFPAHCSANVAGLHRHGCCFKVT